MNSCIKSSCAWDTPFSGFVHILALLMRTTPPTAAAMGSGIMMKDRKENKGKVCIYIAMLAVNFGKRYDIRRLWNNQ